MNAANLCISLQVVSMLMALNPSVVRVFTAAKKVAGRWASFGADVGLWDPRRTDATQRLVDRAPATAFFASRIEVYDRIASAAMARRCVTDIGFLRINCHPAAAACRTQALLLKASYTDALHTLAVQRTRELGEVVQNLRSKLKPVAVDRATLVSALAAVRAILNVRGEIEAAATEVGDQFDLLREATQDSANCECQRNDEKGVTVTAAITVSGEWSAVVNAALTKRGRLEGARLRVCAANEAVAHTLNRDCESLLAQHAATFEFRHSDGADDSSMSALVVSNFTAAVEDAVKRYTTLHQAQRDIEQPASHVSSIDALTSALDALRPLVAVRDDLAAFIIAVDVPGADMASLVVLATLLQRRLDGLSDDSRAVRTFPRVASDVANVCASLPLLVSLQAIEIEPRHLMRVASLFKFTGNIHNPTHDASESMSPIQSVITRTTPSALLLAGLHHHATDIHTIIASAVREAATKRQLVQIIDSWNVRAFNVLRDVVASRAMSRGPGRRQVVADTPNAPPQMLQDAEEVMSDLLRSISTLRSIAASPDADFCTSVVAEWDERLSMALDAVRVWAVVQSAWRHANAKLGGGDDDAIDARARLPEAVAQFTPADADYRALMATTSKRPIVIEAACATGRLGMLCTLRERLTACLALIAETGEDMGGDVT